MEEITAPARE